MIDHDQLFKELLTTFFVEFLALFVPELSAKIDAASVVFMDKELLAGSHRRRQQEADIVARVQFLNPVAGTDARDGVFLVHVENQSARQADFEKRMFRYWARLFEKHKLPIYPIAVLSYDAPQMAEIDRFTVSFPGLKVLDFRYQTIQLNRLSWRDFVKQKNPVASALMAKMAIAPSDRWRVKLECLRLLASMRLDREKMRLISGFIDTYLPLSPDEDHLFQQELDEGEAGDEEAVMEIVTSWMQQGLQQGLQQGMGQVVTLQLQRRFRSLGEASLARVRSLSEPQLVALAEAMLDFTQPSDLDEWFARHAA